MVVSQNLMIQLFQDLSELEDALTRSDIPYLHNVF